MLSGHYPGHIRDTFWCAVETYHKWVFSQPRPTELPNVAHEVRYVPRQISLVKACGLVWNCTDIVPGDLMGIIGDLELPVRRRTYAAVARAMLADIRRLGT